MPLTDKQIRFGFFYFFKDEVEQLRQVVELSEYNGEPELAINCTQLGEEYKSAKEKKRVLNEWCEFLTENPLAFTRLRFNTRMPQALFDAVCHQVKLVDLNIKWGVFRDLAALQNLKALELLFIGSGAGVESIGPISKLDNLKGLFVENFQKISDYSAVAGLKNLESLSICGDGLSPQYVKVDSLAFLRQMKQLRFLQILTVRLQSRDYSPILALENLEHLSLGRHRDVNRLYSELSGLPKLNWGFIKERPELYRK